MDEIGNSFKETRINAKVSLDEASTDTNIPKQALEQIEEGSIGSFKDIYVLKDYLKIYAKYLGLDSDAVIDKFNEYMFEYTSKIPVKTLERAVEKKERREKEEIEKTKEIRVVLPYLREEQKSDTLKIVLITVAVIIVVAIFLIWIIRNSLLK